MADIISNTLTGNFTANDIAWNSGRTIYDWWVGHMQNGAMPARQDFKPMDFPKCLPDICLVDVSGDRNEFYIRLIGTAITQGIGYDPTNSKVSTLKDNEEIFKRYKKTIDSQKPQLILNSTLSWIYKDYLSHHVLYLPLSDDGKNINMLLIVMSFNKK